jgi:hypothetical protein
VIPEKTLVVCGSRKFQVDKLGDHLCTCTTHSGVKKVHDWEVDQLADLFRTTHKVKTQQVVKNRGQHRDDIELVGYLTLDQSLNDVDADKLHKYRADCLDTHCPSPEGVYGVTFNDATKDAAFYTSSCYFVTSTASFLHSTTARRSRLRKTRVKENIYTHLDTSVSWTWTESTSFGCDNRYTCVHTTLTYINLYQVIVSSRLL